MLDHPPHPNALGHRRIAEHDAEKDAAHRPSRSVAKHVRASAFDGGNPDELSAARASLRSVHDGAVTVEIANERHPIIVQIGQYDLALLAGAGRPLAVAVAHDELDEHVLHRDLQ